MTAFTSETARQASKKGWKLLKTNPYLLELRNKRMYESSHAKNHPHIKHEFPINPDLAYVLGTLWGDGCVTKAKRKQGGFQYRIILKVKSKEFADYFINKIKKTINPNVNKCLIMRKGYGLHQKAETNSKPFVDWYKAKSLAQIAELVIEKGEENITQFVKGFFDSEGTAYINLYENTKHSVKREIKMVNTDKEKLEHIQKMLKQLGITVKITIVRQGTKERKTVYGLRINKKLPQCKFIEKVNCTIPRKKRILTQILNYNSRGIIKRENDPSTDFSHRTWGQARL